MKVVAGGGGWWRVKERGGRRRGYIKIWRVGKQTKKRKNGNPSEGRKEGRRKRDDDDDDDEEEEEEEEEVQRRGKLQVHSFDWKTHFKGVGVVCIGFHRHERGGK